MNCLAWTVNCFAGQPARTWVSLGLFTADEACFCCGASKLARLATVPSSSEKQGPHPSPARTRAETAEGKVPAVVADVCSALVRLWLLLFIAAVPRQIERRPGVTCASSLLRIERQVISTEPLSLYTRR